jgi:Spy/CpxP family protein refolding chaperone
MDWVRQDAVKAWLILGLIVLNLIAVSIIWMQTSQRQAPPEQPSRPSDSIVLLQKVLALDAHQVVRAESIMTSRRELSKDANERAAEIKRQLAEELFKDIPDTALARKMAGQIGELQSAIEWVRFRHFLSLVAVCTPEQRTKLRPILIEVFGRKPPKEEAGEVRRLGNGRQIELPQGAGEPERPGTRNERRQGPEVAGPREDERPGPPSMEEKLARYTERLKLSADQVEKVRGILDRSREKGKGMKQETRPDQPGARGSREEMRKEEDARIMEILRPEQKQEFERMQARRNDPRP